VDVSFICNNASATAGVVRGKISEMLCELLYLLGKVMPRNNKANK
jgi:hypothetical protein